VIELQGNMVTLEHLRLRVHVSALSRPDIRVAPKYSDKHGYVGLRYLPAHSTASMEIGLDADPDELDWLHRNAFNVDINLTYVFNRNILIQTGLSRAVRSPAPSPSPRPRPTRASTRTQLALYVGVCLRIFVHGWAERVY
jgi:hypothetical protein